MLSFRRARLEDCVIDADVFALRVALGEDAVEFGLAEGGGDRLKMGRGFGKMLADGTGEGTGGPEEDSAVPVVVADGKKLLGALKVGFFRKAADAKRTIGRG